MFIVANFGCLLIYFPSIIYDRFLAVDESKVGNWENGEGEFMFEP